MSKEFNTTGPCFPEKHYMANMDAMITQTTAMVERGNYFVINRPRQYGKTTTLFTLRRCLQEKYLVIQMSFEGLGDEVFEDVSLFAQTFIQQIHHALVFSNHKTLAKKVREQQCVSMGALSNWVTQFVSSIDKKVIVLIDEVDKSSNNQLFINFLGMLRDKYIKQSGGLDVTFHSVVLAGVHDVKNLKLKIRPDEEKKLNSPWNIAVPFDVDMRLHADAIVSMLADYAYEHTLTFAVTPIAEKLYYYTNGYPFLVSRLCQIIDEKIVGTVKRSWTLDDIEQAVQIILKEANTLFDDLIKNLENNKDLYRLVYDVVIRGEEIGFSMHNPVVNRSVMYGIFGDKNGKIGIANTIFEQLIYNYMSSKIETTVKMGGYNFRDNVVTDKGMLDMEQVLLKFQAFMKEQRSKKDAAFLEREGRLLFLAFIKPIINGSGYDFKEIQISEERRLDVVITFNNARYVVELKIWRGEKAHQKGLSQLSGYLDALGLDKGYLLIYDFNDVKEYKHEHAVIDGKNVCMAWV